MARSRFRELLSKLLGVAVLALVVGAVLAPPDPFTQLYYTIPVLIVGIPYSFWRVYRHEDDGQRIDHG